MTLKQVYGSYTNSCIIQDLSKALNQGMVFNSYKDSNYGLGNLAYLRAFGRSGMQDMVSGSHFKVPWALAV